jgi:hypothetical protein
MWNAETMNLKGWKGIGIALGACLLAATLATPAAQTGSPALVVMSGTDAAAFQKEVATLSQSGLRVTHLFPPSAIIVEETEGHAAGGGPTVKAVYREALKSNEADRLQGTTRQVADAWNIAFFGTAPAAAPVEEGAPENDALEVPQEANGPVGLNGLACTPDAPSKMVSEYMLGSISLNVILPESTGALDASTEDWDAAREAQVLAGVMAGAQWLLDHGPKGPGVALSFTYHLYSGRTDVRAATVYEPIGRSADCTHEPGAGEGLWTNDILNAFGYSGLADRWAKARAFDNDTRIADGTRWAVTLFVVDSLNDADGRFADNRFAYTWQPGSHIVMTYDNSGWGISRLGSVFAHEFCHAFWARDEYSGSGCSCTQLSGYLAGANGNCAATCPSNLATCVMRSADLTGGLGILCPFTARQIGWADDDGNGIPDAVQALPAAQLDTPVSGPGFISLSGYAWVQAAPNHNPSSQAYLCAITIARLSGVQVRLDGSAWHDAVSATGGFGEQTGSFLYDFTNVSGGTHTVEARAVDSLGQVQGTPFSTTVTVEGTTAPPPVPGATYAAKNGGSGFASAPEGDSVTVTWDAASCPAVQTNLYWGYGSGLPGTVGGTYAVAGSVCGLGSTGSIAWSGSPDPTTDSTRLIWWVIVATDGDRTEGSWGHDSAGNEINGATASGQCGNTVKNTSNPGC